MTKCQPYMCDVDVWGRGDLGTSKLGDTIYAVQVMHETEGACDVSRNQMLSALCLMRIFREMFWRKLKMKKWKEIAIAGAIFHADSSINSTQRDQPIRTTRPPVWVIWIKWKQSLYRAKFILQCSRIYKGWEICWNWRRLRIRVVIRILQTDTNTISEYKDAIFKKNYERNSGDTLRQKFNLIVIWHLTFDIWHSTTHLIFVTTITTNHLN